MTKQEFMNIANAIKTYYPRENILPSMEAVTLWFRELEDMDYPETAEALRQHVRTCPYPPAIADLRRIVTDRRLEKERVLTADEAWELVAEAIPFSGSSEEAREEFAALPPEAQEAVGSYRQLKEWALGENLNFTVIARKFRETYNGLMEKRRTAMQAGGMDRAAGKARALTETAARRLSG